MKRSHDAGAAASKAKSQAKEVSAFVESKEELLDWGTLDVIVLNVHGKGSIREAIMPETKQVKEILSIYCFDANHDKFILQAWGHAARRTQDFFE